MTKVFSKKSLKTIFILAAFPISFSARAWESDQYNLPSEPVTDIGPLLSTLAVRKVKESLVEINAGLARVSQERRPKIRESSTKYVAERISRAIIGGGFFRGAAYAKKLVAELRDPKLLAIMNSKELEYMPPKNVYDKFGATTGICAWVTSSMSTPSVNLYGYELGVDKFGHFYSLGLNMYRGYLGHLSRGNNKADAMRKAALEENASESGIFGGFTTGVQSNGDKAANYLGMKFYQNLFEPVIASDGREVDPLLEKTADGFWRMTDESKTMERTYLKRFINDHLNEAMNPNVYANGMQMRNIRVGAKNACPIWFKRYPDRDRRAYEMIEENNKTWFGEDYGYSEHEGRMFKMSNVCF